MTGDTKFFFTSDTHFSHKNILSFGIRPFSTLEEMEEVLINNWNRKVRPGDIVYHLGDFFLGKDPEKACQILDRLNGQKFLIKGNHDYPKVLSGYEHKFVKVEKMHKVKIKDPDAPHGRRLIVLCHYPLVTWDQAHYGAWSFHGHCVDGETEILTTEGWKSRDNISKGDVTLSYSSALGKLEEDRVIELVDVPN